MPGSSGAGNNPGPGEVSLDYRDGVLFLDELLEFAAAR